MGSFVSSNFFTLLFFILFSAIHNNVGGVFYEKVSEGIEMKQMEETTHLHFYFHDIISGKEATVTQIAGPSNTSFGTTMMADDVLTEGPEPGSKVVGKAQGIWAMAAQHDVALLMVMNYVFTEGTFNGSSISILGRNHVFDDVREMPVVGGTGFFRSAHGYALAHTVWWDEQGDAIVEYNVYVTHY